MIACQHGPVDHAAYLARSEQSVSNSRTHGETIVETQTTGYSAESSHLVTKILYVAWLSILLGLFMEAIFLALAASAGGITSLKPFAADAVQKISWSFFVCIGLAAGAIVSKARAALTGLAGLIAAPIAFHIARALHKGAAWALGLGEFAITSPSLLVLAAIKGVEYGCLGAAIAWLAAKSSGGPFAHAAIGLVVGLLFGGLTLFFIHAGAAQTPPIATLIPRAINEFLFPVGCALVLYVAGVLGNKVIH